MYCPARKGSHLTDIPEARRMWARSDDGIVARSPRTKWKTRYAALRDEDGIQVGLRLRKEEGTA